MCWATVKGVRGAVAYSHAPDEVCGHDLHQSVSLLCMSLAIAVGMGPQTIIELAD